MRSDARSERTHVGFVQKGCKKLEVRKYHALQFHSHRSCIVSEMYIHSALILIQCTHGLDPSSVSVTLRTYGNPNAPCATSSLASLRKTSRVFECVARSINRLISCPSKYGDTAVFNASCVTSPLPCCQIKSNMSLITLSK